MATKPSQHCGKETKEHLAWEEKGLEYLAWDEKERLEKQEHVKQKRKEQWPGSQWTGALETLVGDGKQWGRGLEDLAGELVGQRWAGRSWEEWAGKEEIGLDWEFAVQLMVPTP